MSLGLSVDVVGYYRGNSNAQDSSGQGNHGTVVGGITYETTTPIIGAGNFKDDGTGYITLPTAFLVSSGAKTFVFWYKGTSDTTRCLLSVGKSTDGALYNAIFTGNGASGLLTNELITLLRDTTGHRLGYETATRSELFDGNKHLIIVKYSGSVCTIKLDNVVKTITVGDGSNDGLWGGQSGLNRATLLGFGGTSYSSLMLGDVDEVIICNGVTSTDDDTYLWNGGAGRELVSRGRKILLMQDL